jgi:hypothetical protein
MLARLTGTADTDTEHLTALVLGGKDVLVATRGERRGTAVLAARLEEVEVGSPVDRLAAQHGDEGVTVTGFPVAVEGITSRGSYFVGLGAPTTNAPAPHSPRRFAKPRPERARHRRPPGTRSVAAVAQRGAAGHREPGASRGYPRS